MTSVNYEEVFSFFRASVRDYSFVKLDEQDEMEIFTEWLHMALAEPFIRKLFATAQLDDYEQVFSFTMDYPTEEYADRDFILKVLSMQMVVEWLTPKVRAATNVAQMFGGKEQKYYSQSSHLAEIRGLLEDTKLDARKLIRDRGYIHNSYVEGES